MNKKLSSSKICLLMIIFILFISEKEQVHSNFTVTTTIDDNQNLLSVTVEDVTELRALNRYLILMEERKINYLSLYIAFKRSTIIDQFIIIPKNNYNQVFVIIRRIGGFYLSNDYDLSLGNANQLSFYRVSFSFYDKNSKIIVKNNRDNYSLCDNYLRAYYDIQDSNHSTVIDDETLTQMIKNYKGFLSNVIFVSIGTFTGSSFTNELCPIIFQNTFIQSIEINEMTDTWLWRNFLRLSSLEGKYFLSEVNDIQSKIISLLLQNTYNIEINKKNAK